MTTHKRVRGPQQIARCINVEQSDYGPYSPMHCDCGCMIPQATDPVINLAGVVVGKKELMSADYTLIRGNEVVGHYNKQHREVSIGGYQYLGVDVSLLQDLNANITAIREQAIKIQEAEKQAFWDDLHSTKNDHQVTSQSVGYCNLCHSHCYGDCTASVEL